MDATVSIREQHALALLCPNEFSQRMLKHWTTPRPDGLGQHASSALVTLWRIIGESFQMVVRGGLRFGVDDSYRSMQMSATKHSSRISMEFTASLVSLGAAKRRLGMTASTPKGDLLPPASTH